MSAAVATRCPVLRCGRLVQAASRASPVHKSCGRCAVAAQSVRQCTAGGRVRAGGGLLPRPMRAALARRSAPSSGRQIMGSRAGGLSGDWRPVTAGRPTSGAARRAAPCWRTCWACCAAGSRGWTAASSDSSRARSASRPSWRHTTSWARRAASWARGWGGRRTARGSPRPPRCCTAAGCAPGVMDGARQGSDGRRAHTARRSLAMRSS